MRPSGKVSFAAERNARGHADAGRMFGVLGFDTDEVIEERKRDLVYPHRITRSPRGRGCRATSTARARSRATATSPYVAERRGVIFIERSLKQGLEFARHKNNTEGLRAQVRRTITAFLLAQMNDGEFRSREPASASFVDASEELNTPTVIFAGKLIARVGLATNKPAELIILRISQAPHQPGHAGPRGRAGCGGSVTRSYPMTVIGNPRSFHKKFKFIVEIDDIGHAGFQKCNELSVEVANVQYFEGGSLIPNKSPGRLTFSDVTLDRGATRRRTATSSTGSRTSPSHRAASASPT